MEATSTAADSALVATLREQCSCVVCQDVIVPPWFLCPEGHLYCDKCRAATPTCTLCQKTLAAATRARPLEQMAAAAKLAAVCPHAGCSFTGTLDREATQTHGRACSWQHMPCQYRRECAWHGTLTEFINQHMGPEGPHRLDVVPVRATWDVSQQEGSTGVWQAVLPHPAETPSVAFSTTMRRWLVDLTVSDGTRLLLLVQAMRKDWGLARRVPKRYWAWFATVIAGHPVVSDAAPGMLRFAKHEDPPCASLSLWMEKKSEYKLGALEWDAMTCRLQGDARACMREDLPEDAQRWLLVPVGYTQPVTLRIKMEHLRNQWKQRQQQKRPRDEASEALLHEAKRPRTDKETHE